LSNAPITLIDACRIELVVFARRRSVSRSTAFNGVISTIWLRIARS